MGFRGVGSNPKGYDYENFLQSGGNHHKNHRDSINHRPHHHHFSGAVVKVTLLFVVIGLTWLVLNQSDYSTQLVQKSHSFSSPKNSKQRNLSPSRENLASSFHELKSEDLTSYVSDYWIIVFFFSLTV